MQHLSLFALGATPSQYGLVFGISNLAAFLTAPIVGRFGSQIGPKYLYNTGAFVQAIAGLSFGFLDKIENVNAFLGLSYFLRYIQYCLFNKDLTYLVVYGSYLFKILE